MGFREMGVKAQRPLDIGTCGIELLHFKQNRAALRNGCDMIGFYAEQLVKRREGLPQLRQLEQAPG